LAEQGLTKKINSFPGMFTDRQYLLLSFCKKKSLFSFSYLD